MADEATIRSSLSITKDNIEYRSYPNDFTADVTGAKGPTPGSVTVTAAGTDISLAELTVPGFCRIGNQDSTYSMMVGIWDESTSTFHPFQEIAPGEYYTIRMARYIGNEFGSATSTATSGSGNKLRIKSMGGSCTALVEVFER